MKEQIFCKKEFAGLAEALRPPYLIKVGKAITKNAGTFAGIPTDGPTITTMATDLLIALGSREDSEDEQDKYDELLAKDITAIDGVYDFIDLTAAGDGSIVAQAGVNGSSTSTARIGIASTPVALTFEFEKGAGDMGLSRNVDKLGMGTLAVTYTNPATKVIKSSDKQLKITTAAGDDIFIDIETTSKMVIKNLIKATEIMSVVTIFNTNGISPVASPAPIVVPR